MSDSPRDTAIVKRSMRDASCGLSSTTARVMKVCNGFTARCGQETVAEHGHGDDDGQDAEAVRSKYPGGEG